LVNAKGQEWQGKKITIEDSSQYSGKPVRIEFKNGRVTALDPATTRVFFGGG